MRALVVGGTGPTGHLMVNGLRRRGYAVAILHTGNHELDEIPDDVEHIHTNPYEIDLFNAALDGRSFDLAIVTYGRLRKIAEALAGRVGRFISIGGVPAYRGFMNPELMQREGLATTIVEDAPLVRGEAEDAKGWRIVRTEQAVFHAQPDATHFRYPYLYGPLQLVPREWCIVRRILDGRRHIILPDGGLTLHHYCYVENAAEAVLRAVDRPEASKGEIYHCADEEVLSLRQLVDVIAAALDHPLEIVSLPWSLATPAKPLVGQPLPTHRVLDLSKLRRDLDYRDAVPAREALRRTAHWLALHRPAPGGTEETVLQDPFDYAAEDRLIEAWSRAMEQFPEVEFTGHRPGYGLAYSGPGGRAPGREEFEE